MDWLDKRHYKYYYKLNYKKSASVITLINLWQYYITYMHYNIYYKPCFGISDTASWLAMLVAHLFTQCSQEQ